MHEPLFDTSDLKSLKSELDLNPQSPTASLLERGASSLEIALLYDAPMRKMTVHVLQARGIPSREKQTTHTQVRLLILPSKKQKHKTKIRSGENPQFMERWGCLWTNIKTNSDGESFQLFAPSSEPRGSQLDGPAGSCLWLREDATRAPNRRDNHQFRDDRFGIGDEFVAAAGAEK